MQRSGGAHLIAASQVGACFNCMGEHSLAFCQEPKDARRIARNKQAFMGSRENG